MKWLLRHIAVSIILVLSTQLMAQDSLTFVEVDSIRCFDVDNKGNYFIVDQHNSIFKFNSTAEEVTRVNIKNYGNIFSIDCSNPFEIYVWYKEQNIVVFFDNMLNFRGEMKLNALGFNNVSCVARSYDNGLWIFDLNMFELLKLNKDGSIQAQSVNILSLVESDFAPQQITETEQAVYLSDQENGILKFDLFASYINTLHLGTFIDLSIEENTVYLLTEESLISYDQKAHRKHEKSVKSRGYISGLSSSKLGLFLCQKNIIFKEVFF